MHQCVLINVKALQKCTYMFSMIYLHKMSLNIVHLVWCCRIDFSTVFNNSQSFSIVLRQDFTYKYITSIFFIALIQRRNGLNT